MHGKKDSDSRSFNIYTIDGRYIILKSTYFKMSLDYGLTSPNTTVSKVNFIETYFSTTLNYQNKANVDTIIKL
jgi:hypothetical protein